MNWFWGCAGTALAISSLPMRELLNYEARITRYTIDDPAWQGKGNLRVALISDFHAGDQVWSGRALARLVRKEAVDLVCIVGDFFEPGRSDVEAMRFVEEIGGWHPVYYVSGNHDEGERYLDDLKDKMARQYGVHVLDNRHILVRAKDTWVDIFGVRDRGGFADEAAWLSDVKKAASSNVEKMEDAYKIALCHRPEPKVLFDELDRHLFLCGHTHGGQWRVMNRGVYAPGQGVLPKYSKGVYQRHKKSSYHMVVSAGLAIGNKVPRVNNRPELVIIDIHNS